MAKRRQGATRHGTEVVEKVSLGWLAPVLLSALAMVTLYLGWIYLQDPETLPVRKVRIESPLKQVTQQQLREVIEVHAQSGFLGLDVDTVRHELESMPWVYRATVRRGWPDVLVVRVEEEQAVARWGNSGLLNRRGELFEPDDSDAWSQLPLLRGPVGMEKVVAEKYRQMIDMLIPLGLKVSHLTVDERRAWNLQLSNGLQMVLGRDDTHLRLLRFVRVYTGVLKPRLKAIDGVDLRYTNGFAVRWREGFAPASA
jgi:cell division protein FtsQ